jgi:hypothetical protein
MQLHKECKRQGSANCADPWHPFFQDPDMRKEPGLGAGLFGLRYEIEITYVPMSWEARYFTCSAVRVSMPTPMD